MIKIKYEQNTETVKQKSEELHRVATTAYPCFHKSQK